FDSKKTAYHKADYNGSDFSNLRLPASWICDRRCEYLRSSFTADCYLYCTAGFSCRSFDWQFDTIRAFHFCERFYSDTPAALFYEYLFVNDRHPRNVSERGYRSSF